jgi:hypothetical protein
MSFVLAKTTTRLYTENSSFGCKLPVRYSNQNQVESEITKSLSNAIGNSIKILGATLGLDVKTRDLYLIGLTQDFLLLAKCIPSGNTPSSQFILREDVKWVSGTVGEFCAMLTVKWNSEENITFQTPKYLGWQTKAIATEFPGCWSGSELRESVLDLKRELARDLVMLLPLIIVLFIGTSYTDSWGRVSKTIAVSSILSLVLIYAGCALLKGSIKIYCLEPGISFSRIFSNLFPFMVSLFIWSLSIYLSGDIFVSLAKMIYLWR